MTTSVSPVELHISRTINAPREKVWKACSDADRLARWWGPKGSTLRVVRLDFRPGGIFHYAFQFQPGHDLFGRFIYREIVPQERIVFVSSFSDAQGGIAPAPFPNLENWPREVHNTWTLTEDGGRTTLTLRGYPLDASEAEQNTFTGMIDSMKGGFGGTLDQLDAYLAGQ
jgi:uncharacterized protein YndB with AHSA1/START domain